MAFLSTAIYRGCFDAFKAVKQLTDDYVGCRNQTWNNRVRRWCLCDTDLCNRFPIEHSHQRLPLSRPYRRLSTHHHPLPPPQRAPTKIYLKNSADKMIGVEDEKGVEPTSYRTVWTNLQSLAGTQRHAQPNDRRPGVAEKKTGGSRRPDSRRQDLQLGHVVSHSVYPDQWKANLEALIDRQHAKSSQNVANGRPEPLSFSDEGQTSRSNHSAPRIIEEYQPPPVESQARSTSAVDRQGSRGMFR